MAISRKWLLVIILGDTHQLKTHYGDLSGILSGTEMINKQSKTVLDLLIRKLVGFGRTINYFNDK